MLRLLRLFQFSCHNKILQLRRSVQEAIFVNFELFCESFAYCDLFYNQDLRCQVYDILNAVLRT